MMRDSTPPQRHLPELPSGQAQAVARKQQAQNTMLMLLASAALWAAIWGLWHTLPKEQATAAPQTVTAQPLPVKTYGHPHLTIALAERPQPVADARKAQRVRSDLVSLFGHVAGSLVRDELETMVLRLSLGQQVAVHLRQDFLE
jgi:hypothetical protein